MDRSLREQIAAAELLEKPTALEDLHFIWSTTLAVGSCAQILDVIEVRDVDENERLGYVVFNPDGTVLTAFAPPHGDG